MPARTNTLFCLLHVCTQVPALLRAAPRGPHLPQALRLALLQPQSLQQPLVQAPPPVLSLVLLLLPSLLL
jgi:hypothetical protein